MGKTAKLLIAKVISFTYKELVPPHADALNTSSSKKTETHSTLQPTPGTTEYDGSVFSKQVPAVYLVSHV
jgi:hypothetical protein